MNNSLNSLNLSESLYEQSDHTEQDNAWTADRYWSSEPSLIRPAVQEFIGSRPVLRYMYREEQAIAKGTGSETANDPCRYIAFPLAEASDVVGRVKKLVNNSVEGSLIGYDWLSLIDYDADMNEGILPHHKLRYLSKDDLCTEVEKKTGFILFREIHDELSAQQTQYFISRLLIDATDINWQ